ncbi:ferritin-like domain-containing protein [Pseudonocardia sp.]|uniref:ferritin-like domain-containing protein n=1 Tax=Pseudonocardia sp. TaxID=60912 RepID=UPI00261258A4|nr:ferritin-like domain-containing protein [Pseudonocardia sp.]MCW2721874.1 hypothetical protein [Pseudonocardia sp.]
MSSPTPQPYGPNAAPSNGPSTIDRTAAAALQDALGAEHAALWSYSLILAFLPGDQLAQARADEEAHRVLRGAVEQTLVQIGTRPISAQPAYATPKPVTDGVSAAALAVVAETDAMTAWRSVLEHTTDRGLRQAALNALTESTLRCAHWRVVVNTPPAIPTFPGQP